MGADVPPVETFSIAACDLDAGQWGVSVASKFLAVGSVLPFAEPAVGAIATQSWANPRYGPDGLAMLRAGRSANETIAKLIADDEDRDERQVGVVDALGDAATFTGSACHQWAGGRTGRGYAAQGNLLVSETTVQALAATFERNGHLELPERLIECLAAAQAAGGDRRGQQSAALLVVRLARLGFDGDLVRAFTQWAGAANLEARVDGVDRIDQVVHRALRKASM